LLFFFGFFWRWWWWWQEWGGGLVRGQQKQLGKTERRNKRESSGRGRKQTEENKSHLDMDSFYFFCFFSSHLRKNN